MSQVTSQVTVALLAAAALVESSAVTAPAARSLQSVCRSRLHSMIAAAADPTQLAWSELKRASQHTS